MSDIISSITKMNDIEINADAALSEALFLKIGANINALIDRSNRRQIFTASGTFTAPSDATYVMLYGCGGGGGGGGVIYSSSNNTYASGGGGGGSLPIFQMVPVVPLTSYTVTIGAGGSGGVSGVDRQTNGGQGGTTTFGTLAGFDGAGGGNYNAGAGRGWAPRLQQTAGGNPNNRGDASITTQGGFNGTSASNGGGGGSSIGQGGTGGTGLNGTAFISPTAGGIGAGGGGSSYSSNGNNPNGAPGGPGFLMVIY